jgi:hypothetical protein
MAGNLGFQSYLVADACFTFARRDFRGRLRTADEAPPVPVRSDSSSKSDRESGMLIRRRETLLLLSIGRLLALRVRADEPAPNPPLWLIERSGRNEGMDVVVNLALRFPPVLASSSRRGRLMSDNLLKRLVPHQGCVITCRDDAIEIAGSAMNWVMSAAVAPLICRA